MNRVVRLPVEFKTHRGMFDPIDISSAWRNGFKIGFIAGSVCLAIGAILHALVNS